MSTPMPPGVQLSASELGLLRRARAQRQAEHVPDAVRERLFARVVDVAQGQPSVVVSAAELTVVPMRPLRSAAWLLGVAALAVVLLSRVRDSIRNSREGSREPQAQLEAEGARGAAGARWLDTPLFRAPAPTLPSGEPPPRGPNLFAEAPFSMRSAAWQVRRWDDLSVAPTVSARHDFKEGALCVSLGPGERVLGGWPWAASSSVAPKGVPLAPGKPYRLVFKAWAHEPLPAQLLIAVGHVRLPFSAAAGARVPVTTEPQSFVIDFASEHGDPSVGVAFLATSSKDASEKEPTRVCLSELTLTERSLP